MRYALHDDPALDARLRAKLTAQLPQQPDLWPQIAARLPAVPSHRRRAFAVLVAAAIAAALLMGAAVLHGFSVYDTATGLKIDLDAGEAYVPGMVPHPSRWNLPGIVTRTGAAKCMTTAWNGRKPGTSRRMNMTRTVRQSHPVRRCLIFLTPRSSVS